MFCVNCGNKIISGERFCTNCGHTFKLTEDKNPVQIDVKTGNKIVKKILKFCLWVALIGFGIWLIIALGPLWIIAIILLLMLFVLLNK